MEYLSNYGLFLAKIVTLVLAILVVVFFVAGLAMKEKHADRITIKKLNEKYDELRQAIKSAILSKHDFKKFVKAQKKLTKAEKKADESTRKRIYVLQFKGDIKASAVSALREEITAVLTVATPLDEIVVKLESAGGMVHAYGLAASQLQRIRDHKIPLTVIVDKVAASGGYLMACVADKILAAPFSIIGSIGVLAQMPNFHRLLKKHNIDFEQITAGEYKRTLTVFGENTDKGRKKFKEEMEEIHGLFKEYIGEHRPNIDLAQVATGEHWLAKRAMDFNLVDELMTSDDFLLTASETADLFEVEYLTKKTLPEKIFSSMETAFKHFLP